MEKHPIRECVTLSLAYLRIDFFVHLNNNFSENDIHEYGGEDRARNGDFCFMR